MKKVARWVAEHQKGLKIAATFLWWGCGLYVFLSTDIPASVALLLVLVLHTFYNTFISASSDYLQQEALKPLYNECDPYPFLEEMKTQQTYHGSEVTKQGRVIHYALALRNVGAYEQAYMQLCGINIDKYAGMVATNKAVYYNNLMDLCFLMGKHQEANIWYGKATQIFHDLKSGKQKERLRRSVEDNRALYHFCNGEYELTLQVLSKTQPKDLRDRVENAMMYARTYLAMGEPEKARKPLQFVAEKGNKLYFATEAKGLLANIKMEET